MRHFTHEHPLYVWYRKHSGHQDRSNEMPGNNMLNLFLLKRYGRCPLDTPKYTDTPRKYVSLCQNGQKWAFWLTLFRIEGGIQRYWESINRLNQIWKLYYIQYYPFITHELQVAFITQTTTQENPLSSKTWRVHLSQPLHYNTPSLCGFQFNTLTVLSYEICSLSRTTDLRTASTNQDASNSAKPYQNT